MTCNDHSTFAGISSRIASAVTELLTMAWCKYTCDDDAAAAGEGDDDDDDADDDNDDHSPPFAPHNQKASRGDSAVAGSHSAAASYPDETVLTCVGADRAALLSVHVYLHSGSCWGLCSFHGLCCCRLIAIPPVWHLKLCELLHEGISALVHLRRLQLDVLRWSQHIIHIIRKPRSRRMQGVLSLCEYHSSALLQQARLLGAIGPFPSPKAAL